MFISFVESIIDINIMEVPRQQIPTIKVMSKNCSVCYRYLRISNKEEMDTSPVTYLISETRSE